MAALVVAAAGVVAVPAAGAPGCAPQRRFPDLWTELGNPFAALAGGAVMTAYDVADPVPGHLVATNGVTVAATTDDGCRWTLARLPAETPPAQDLGEAQVVGHAISQVRYAALSRYVVWAIGQTDLVAPGLATSRPRVLLSMDSGLTFASRRDGLPQFGRPVAIRGFGLSAALLFHETVPSSRYHLYVTADGGLSWQPAWEDLEPLRDMALDPLRQALWLWGSAGLYTGGLADPAPRLVAAVNGPVKAVDVTGGLVSVFLDGGSERFVSADGGKTFDRRAAPEGVRSASGHLAMPGLLAISSERTNVLVELPARLGRPPVDFSPREANVSELQFAQSVEPAGFPLYAFHALALYRRMVPLDFAVPPPPPEPPPLDVEVRPRPPVRQVSEVAPRRPVIRLPNGGARTVPFRFDLAPVPTPLDVFFMTDSTSSMKNTIASVQEGVQDIVDELAWRGVDVRFGVADFRDYPERTDDPEKTPNYPYKRRRAVGPIDTAFAEALEGITTGGGKPDGHDAGLEAIYQAVTGAGRVDPLDPSRVLIEPGQGAGFRPEAMKVVLVATDDNFRHPVPGYPGPAVDTVSRALVAAGVYLVGIHVETKSGSARADMERLAEDTGAIAPAGGLDCDADGRPDLRKSDPIVCDFDPTTGDGVASAFVGMLAGIRDEARLDLAVTAPPALARPLGRTAFPKVNVKAESTFTLPVRFTCPAGLAGSETPVRIAARSRGAEVVATTATLECVPPAPPPDRPPVIPPAVVAALVPPPPPPPAPVANAQPNLNPHVNPNPNPQLNANTGMAAQEDQEFQLALADNELTREDLAMTGLDRAAPTVPAAAWAAAAAMTAAAAFGLHLRRRLSPAPAYAPFDPREHR